MNILFLVRSFYLHERHGIMILSSILKKRGHDVKLLITEDLSESECLEKVKQLEPDVLAYSIMTGEHLYHIDLNAKIKKRVSCFSVFGGPHPTFRPQIIEHPAIDAVCIGEGDLSFPELVDKLAGGKDFYRTPNFWLKKPNGSIVKNEPGPLVEDLDSLPFPDRELLYSASPALKLRGKKTFMSMRGCPYRCSYCFNHKYSSMVKGKGRYLRYRSVDNIIEEIRQVKDSYFLDRVLMDDDTFLIKPQGWLEEFASRYSKEIGLPFTCYVRSDLVNEENAALLKQMGCELVFMGVEAPDPIISDRLLKRNIPAAQTIEACSLLKRNNIKVGTQTLLGLPVDNPLEAAFCALDFNIKLKPYLAFPYLLYPYPGTSIRDVAIEKGMFSKEHEKEEPDNQNNTSLLFENQKTKKRLINLSKLFAILVQFPFLRPFTGFLISLPLSYIYSQMFYVFFGYKMFRFRKKKWLLQLTRSYIPFYFKSIIKIGK